MSTREEIMRKSDRGQTTGWNGGADDAPGINTQLILEVLLDIRDLLVNSQKE